MFRQNNAEHYALIAFATLAITSNKANRMRFPLGSLIGFFQTRPLLLLRDVTPTELMQDPSGTNDHLAESHKSDLDRRFERDFSATEQ